jgi:hypothetical protein
MQFENSWRTTDAGTRLVTFLLFTERSVVYRVAAKDLRAWASRVSRDAVLTPAAFGVVRFVIASFCCAGDIR